MCPSPLNSAMSAASEAASAIGSIRRSRGLTLQQLSDSAGVPVGRLAAAEEGRRELRLDECAAVLASMGCNLEYKRAGAGERA